MQLNRFDLNLLIALDALLHERNGTRAAERVFISQPAMSAAFQKLREFFEDLLLVRVGRDMQPTPRGLSLGEPVREALLELQTTLGHAPVKLLPVPFETQDTHEGVIWHEHNEPDRGHAWLRAVLIAAAQPTSRESSRDDADDPP
jgi:DNA-binding transcriptional LysR family regulator